ncbi:hypothetical protein K435DRAFT_467488 [Dendrothele bispora CBS 962.96]|uniref:Uncharacterized protein n=1 Tax=Dendrothele bispora (strain CBS 962.96) TaxID=1314807 RepID=A0A4S8L0P5_DENBC|nr:hypothetical protein K435DRAFT_467488 [Dendrothele bispora CBS 962.96]
MIAANAQLVLGSSEDSEWTFGQIISIILVANLRLGFGGFRRVLEAEWDIGVGNVGASTGVGAGRETNMKLGMGSSRRNTRDGKRDKEEGEEGKEGLERLEKRKDGEEEEDWESLRERPVAMLVVGVQRRWREGPRFSWRSSRGNGRERDGEYPSLSGRFIVLD